MKFLIKIKTYKEKWLIVLVLFIFFCIVYHFAHIFYSNKYAYFTNGPNMNYNRYISSTIELDNKNIFMLGWNNSSRSKDTSKKAEMYILNNNAFIKLPDTNYKHYGATYLFKADNKIFLLDNNPVEYYLIDKNVFIKTDLCILDNKCKPHNKEDGNFIQFNAYKYNSDKILVYSNFTNSQLYFWNHNTGIKTPLPNFNIQRKDCGILVLNSGEIIVAGGYDSHNNAILSAEIYKPNDNRFHIMPNFQLDSEIKAQLKPNGEYFETKQFRYSFEQKRNKFIKTPTKKTSTKCKAIDINNDISLLIFNKCGLTSCTSKTKLYLKNKNMTLKGPDLLYQVNIPTKIIKIANNKYLLYGSNYSEMNTRPIRSTQILNIK